MGFCLEKEDFRRAVFKFQKLLADNFSESAMTKSMTKSQLLVVSLFYFQEYREMGFDLENEESISNDVFTFQNFIMDKYPLEFMTKLMSREQLLDLAMYYFNKTQEAGLYLSELIDHEEVLI